MTMQAIEDVRSAFEQFKKHNDARLDEIEKNGSANPETLEAVNKANAAIEELTSTVETLQNVQAEERIKEIENRQNRLMLTTGRVTDEQMVNYANWQSAIQGVPVDPSNVDMDFVRGYKKAFNDWFRHGESRMSAESHKFLNEMSVISESDGGYWVDPDASGRVATLIYETSPIRQFASVQSISSDALEGTVDLDEAATGGWVAEKATRAGNTGTPEVGTWRIPAHEQYAEPRATQKLLDDAAVDVESWLAGKVANKFRRDENTAFVTGTGVTQPRGFTDYPDGVASATNWQQIEQVISGHATLLQANGLIDLVFALKSEYRAGSIFGMSRTTEREVRQLVDGQNNYLWQPDFRQMTSASLLGFPVVEMADMPAIAANATPIVFGNLGIAYQIVDRIGIRVLRDPYTTKGFVKFYTTKRTGGDVIGFEAIKLQKISA